MGFAESPSFGDAPRPTRGPPICCPASLQVKVQNERRQACGGHPRASALLLRPRLRDFELELRREPVATAWSDRRLRSRPRRWSLASEARAEAAQLWESLLVIHFRYVYHQRMRHLLLGLLAKEPAHGYELKRLLDERLGQLSPPVNIGQIYTTLRRLERDGLVSSAEVSQPDRPDKRVFELTAQGRDDLGQWLAETTVDVRVREPVFLKLVVAMSGGGPDPLALVDRHRRALLRRLREVQILEDPNARPVERMAVEGAVLHLQADLRWLEVCEQLLTRTQRDEEGQR